MPNVSVTGQDTLIINGNVITGLADGNAVDLTPFADISAVKRGKDANLMFAKNEQGNMANMTFRLALGCSDDNTMDGLFANWQASSSDFVLLTGAFYKRVGDGHGNITSKIYQLSSGVFKNFPEVMTTSEGNVDQSVRIWNLIWGYCSISDQ